MSDSDTFEAERVLIETTFESAWNQRTAIRWENVGWEEPKTDNNFVSVAIRSGPGDLISLAYPTGMHRYSGVVIVQVFQRADTGTALARELAGLVADIFRRKELSSTDAGKLVFRTPYVTTAQVDAGGWYQLNVACPFS